METARESIASTLRKNEKVLETLTAKNARQWQIERTAAAVRQHKTMLAILTGDPAEPQDLEAAMAAIPVYISRIEQILPKFAPGTPQHTLALRRIAAYRLVLKLGRKKEEQTC